MSFFVYMNCFLRKAQVDFKLLDVLLMINPSHLLQAHRAWPKQWQIHSKLNRLLGSLPKLRKKSRTRKTVNVWLLFSRCFVFYFIFQDVKLDRLSKCSLQRSMLLTLLAKLQHLKGSFFVHNFFKTQKQPGHQKIIMKRSTRKMRKTRKRKKRTLKSPGLSFQCFFWKWFPCPCFFQGENIPAGENGVLVIFVSLFQFHSANPGPRELDDLESNMRIARRALENAEEMLKRRLVSYKLGLLHYLKVSSLSRCSVLKVSCNIFSPSIFFFLKKHRLSFKFLSKFDQI